MRFRHLNELAKLCADEGLTIGELMLAEQAAESGHPPASEFAKMADYYAVMKDAVKRGLTEDTTSRSGITGLDAQRVAAYNGAGASNLGIAGDAMAYALAVSEVNASMGRIIATPTAGSCGIIPGVFVSCQERFGWSDEHMTYGLFAAGAIGYVIANNSFVSGAEGGSRDKPRVIGPKTSLSTRQSALGGKPAGTLAND